MGLRRGESGVVRMLVPAVGAVVLFAGCGAAEEAAKSGQTPAPRPSQQVHTVAVGRTLTLVGDDDSGGRGRLRLVVKVAKVLQTATGRGAYAKPRKGERFAAVRFVLKNVGDTAYDDSPTYGAEVIDGQGRNYDPLVATVSAGPGFAKAVRLRRGQSRSGYIVFSVPKNAEITAVRYALNAGFAQDVGEWRVH